MTAASVLVSPSATVRHLAVWAPRIGPLCRNPSYNDSWDYDPYNDIYGALPWCARCQAEAELLFRTVMS